MLHFRTSGQGNSKFKIQNAECTPKVCFLTVRYEVRE